jgi:hypothetical protein
MKKYYKPKKNNVTKLKTYLDKNIKNGQRKRYSTSSSSK